MKIRLGNVAGNLLAGCLWCVSTGHGQGQAAIEVPFVETVEHFASGSTLIHSSGPSDRIQLKIVVTPDGAVQSVTPESGSSKWREQAASLAKTWKYAPFQRNGKPILATFSADVNVVPPERRPVQHPSSQAPFPEISDWNSLRITLRRTRCYGTCPSYVLTISGDGNVTYSGDAYVRFCGDLHGHVSQDAIQQLLRLFKTADYFNVFDHYAMGITDAPTYTTSIAFDGKSKSVIDYDGVWVGMPEAVLDIETAVDRLAGPNVWAKGTDANGDVNRPCR